VRRQKWVLPLVIVVACAAEVVGAGAPGAELLQRRGGRGRMIPVEPNPPYDGQFTFVRLRYGPPTNYVAQSIPWSHDYPNGERHFMKILNELTMMRPHLEETSILGFDDPEVFKYPLAYMAEPGFLQLSEAEVAGFSAYLKKRRVRHLRRFLAVARRLGTVRSPDVACAARGSVRRSRRHASDFSLFFRNRRFEYRSAELRQRPADFRGIFEDNDPAKRLLVMINFNTDISEYWEFSDTGLKPISENNEAYKLGVNYILYGMTH
jgi:hypothetical protein